MSAGKVLKNMMRYFRVLHTSYTPRCFFWLYSFKILRSHTIINGNAIDKFTNILYNLQFHATMLGIVPTFICTCSIFYTIVPHKFLAFSHISQCHQASFSQPAVWRPLIAQAAIGLPVSTCRFIGERGDVWNAVGARGAKGLAE